MHGPLYVSNTVTHVHALSTTGVLQRVVRRRIAHAAGDCQHGNRCQKLRHDDLSFRALLLRESVRQWCIVFSAFKLEM